MSAADSHSTSGFRLHQCGLNHERRSIASVLTLVLALLPTSRCLGQIPADAERCQAQSQLNEFQQLSNTRDQLEYLLKIAPARQLGQPGNEVVDLLIQEAFAAAVSRHTPDPKRTAEVRHLLNDADRADHAIANARQNLQILTSNQQLTSPWYVANTVENPGLTMTLLLLTTALFLAAWSVQHRTVLLSTAVILGGLATVLPIMAVMVTTEVEGANRTISGGVKTIEQLNQQMLDAARASVKADHAAAKALAGMWQHGRIQFPTTVFLPGKAHLQTESGATVDIYQLAPNLVEPANLPHTGYTGHLIYVGAARPADLAPHDLAGAAVLVDFNCDRRWLDAVQLGAEVVVLLEPPDDAPIMLNQAAQKISNAPLSIPRFYLRRQDLLATFGPNWQSRLADGEPALIHQAPGRWQRQLVATDWLFIPAANPADQRLARQLVHLQTYKDSASIVPQHSPGAASAANLVMLLRLLASLEKAPPHRPVLLSVVNDHCNAMHGEQVFAFSAFTPARVILEEMEELECELARHRFVTQVYAEEPNHKLIEHLRTATEEISKKSFRLKDPVVNYLRRTRNQIREQNNQIKLRLKHHRQRQQDQQPRLLADAQRAELEAQVKRYEQRTAAYVRMMGLFNRLGSRTEYRDLPKEQRNEVRNLFAVITQQALGRADHLDRQLRRLRANLALRRRLLWLGEFDTPQDNDDYETLMTQRWKPLPAGLALTLDLTFGSDRVGLFHHGFLVGGNFRDEQFARDAKNRSEYVATDALRVANHHARRTGLGQRLADTIRMARGLTWQTHMGGAFAIPARIIQAYGWPAVTVTTVGDARPFSFSPHDDLAHMEWRHFGAITSFLETLLPTFINDARVRVAAEPHDPLPPMVAIISVRQTDKYSVKISEVPLPGALVVPAGTMKAPKNISMLGQVRPWPVLMTDVNGNVTLRSRIWDNTSVQVYGYEDDTFRQIRAVLDFGEGERRFPSVVEVGTARVFKSQTMMTFDAKKVDLIGVSEPLTLKPIAGIALIDAAQESRPRHFAVAGVPLAKTSQTTKFTPLSNDGTASVFIEPGMHFKLWVGDGLAINAARPAKSDEEGKGLGFSSDSGILRQLLITSAQDMCGLATMRLSKLSDRGVKNTAADEYRQDAQRSISAAHAAPGDPRVDAERARGMAAHAYTQSLGTLNDLIKAVVVFLALALPFSFFVMKLVTPYEDINRQLALFAMVFVVMAVVLQLVHPAFKVTQRPQVVVLAFVILGLAAFVATIVISRFDASMTQAVEESLLAESASTSQSRLAGAAFMVGINNMKRRRIRTSLTCATIVLVTFTTLSVISISQDPEPLRRRMGSDAAYDGFVFVAPGLARIDPLRVQRTAAHFDGRAHVVARAWAQRQDDFGALLPYELRPDKPVSDTAQIEAIEAKVLVGLEMDERGFLPQKLPIVAGRWFSANSAQEVVLSQKSAELIGIHANNFQGVHLRVLGHRLELVGLIDDTKIEQIKDLAEVPLVPLLAAASLEKERKKAAEEDDIGTLEDAGSVADVPGLYPARAQEVAFVPIDFAMATGESEYRCLSIKFTVPEGEKATETQLAALSRQAWDEANTLTRYQHLRLSVGLRRPVHLEQTGQTIEAGEYIMMSSRDTQISGMLKIAIPVVLAVTIILNTMIGSVMERKREIAIYNAIGLNPTHVMVFFLAESLVFGIVGSVAGYLIGQVLGLGVNLFLPLNLNYSSLSVVVVIFLTIGTVLLSTIYPAMMAARAAVPSGQRRWSLPQPEADQIHVPFPFSYDADRVLGVCAYLRDFMKQNSEASTGKFLAKLGPVGHVPVEIAEQIADGGERKGANALTAAPQKASAKAYAMVFDIAPAPFDLGVNQTMEVYAYYDRRVRAHMLSVHLTRLSGQTSNWVAVNQPFLEMMRKRLLSWRSQKTETQQAYYRTGCELFDSVGDLPYVSDDGRS